MLKTFPIDFIRQIFEQKLFEEHQKNPHLFGGKNQVNIFSFYEQLKSQEQVDRFVETYRDLTNQQNRTGLILNGVLVSPENPTITNLYSSTIIPMTWTCSMRCTLDNRDASIVTINNLIKELKGRKVDVAQLECVDDNGNKYTEPFMVGTIGQNDGEPQLKNGDYVGDVANANAVLTNISNYVSNGVTINWDTPKYLYCKNANKIKVAKAEKIVDVEEEQVVDTIGQTWVESGNYVYVEVELDGIFTDSDITRATASLTINGANNESVTLSLENGVVLISGTSGDKTLATINFVLDQPIASYVTSYSGFDLEDVEAFVENQIISYNATFIEDDGSVDEIVFPPEHTSFEKYKVSLSFDAVRCDEPRNLNEKEYCELSFGGSATLVNNGVMLGNDLLKVSISKTKILNAVSSFASNITYLEPLEMPSGNSANTKINQLVSNKFLTNTHTDATNITLQYTFIVDTNVPLLEQLFDYARYGTRGITINDISQNMIFTNKEYWCSWGEYKVQTYFAKIVENIDIENTESDTLTLTTTFQVQGENN